MKGRIKLFIFVGLLVLAIVSSSSSGVRSMTTFGQTGAELDSILPDDDLLYLPMVQKSKPSFEYQMVQRFAPVLAFDGSYKGLPMSAEAYFQNMLTIPDVPPLIADPYITWGAERYPDVGGYGPFTNYTGWDDPKYFPTIQSADVNGDGQAELLGRSSCGMDTWHLKPTMGAWYKIASCSPAWSDADGWGVEQYYGTIQTADIDGDHQAELLGRSTCGMETWHFNASNNTWKKVASCSPAWGDAEGWGVKQYYGTIQTADIDGDHQAELLARAPCGMETWHFNASSNTWEKVASCSPAWGDAEGWGVEQYYGTIQSADVDKDGQAELLARAPCGMETWHFNASSNTWEKVVGCSPAWGDAEGWDLEQYYGTIQSADVDGDGQAELLGRSSCGMDTWHFNASSDTWESLASCSPGFTDPGWVYPYYYRTIQTADIDGDGQAELLARAPCGMMTYRFNASSFTWEGLAGCNPGFSDPNWALEQYYSTIQTGDVDGDDQAELLARSQLGTYSYNYSSTFGWPQLSPLVRSNLCGRDDCQWGLSNNNFATLTNGDVPTYYRVSYDPATGRARIAYWWFYGWQQECYTSCDGHEDGAHHGDWENILVTTTADRQAVEYVTYVFHGNWYTRQRPNFQFIGERPVVYVGKIAHGSYHSQDCSGWMAGTPSQCCEYADYRDPNSITWWNTSQNLVDLDSNSEAWMLADRQYQSYNYNGTLYTIVPWYWGPLHSWCALCGTPCNDWRQETACGTHPTTVDIIWSLKSCGGVGCGGYKALCPYNCTYNHNNGWIWDT